MSIRFSIVVPCFNTEKSIVSTLDSIINQTYSKYEILAVNDGSTDNTLEILKTYKKENEVNLQIIDQANRGLGGARNSGIMQAQYDFIAFLDADDLWYPEKLMKVMKLLEKNPDIDLVCNDEEVLKHGRRIRRNSYGPYKTYEDLLFKGNCLSGSAVVVKRSKLFDVGLFSQDRSIHGIEDYDLWMKLAKSGAKFSFLHEILGAYVLHENNMTAEIESFFDRSYRLLNRHLDEYSNRDFLFRIKARIRRGNEFRAYSREWLLSDDFGKARRFAFEALKYYPFCWKNVGLGIACLLKKKI